VSRGPGIRTVGVEISEIRQIGAIPQMLPREIAPPHSRILQQRLAILVLNRIVSVDVRIILNQGRSAQLSGPWQACIIVRRPLHALKTVVIDSFELLQT